MDIDHSRRRSLENLPDEFRRIEIIEVLPGRNTLRVAGVGANEVSETPETPARILMLPPFRGFVRTSLQPRPPVFRSSVFEFAILFVALSLIWYY